MIILPPLSRIRPPAPLPFVETAIALSSVDAAGNRCRVRFRTGQARPLSTSPILLMARCWTVPVTVTAVAPGRRPVAVAARRRGSENGCRPSPDAMTVLETAKAVSGARRSMARSRQPCSPSRRRQSPLTPPPTVMPLYTAADDAPAPAPTATSLYTAATVMPLYTAADDALCRLGHGYWLKLTRISRAAATPPPTVIGGTPAPLGGRRRRRRHPNGVPPANAANDGLG